MPWKTSLDERVTGSLPTLDWLRDEPLARHTSFRIGGPAARMAFPATAEELTVLNALARSCGARVIWLGNGTNMLFPDEGVDALVIATTAMKHFLC